MRASERRNWIERSWNVRVNLMEGMRWSIVTSRSWIGENVNDRRRRRSASDSVSVNTKRRNASERGKNVIARRRGASVNVENVSAKSMKRENVNVGMSIASTRRGDATTIGNLDLHAIWMIDIGERRKKRTAEFDAETSAAAVAGMPMNATTSEMETKRIRIDLRLLSDEIEMGDAAVAGMNVVRTKSEMLKKNFPKKNFGYCERRNFAKFLVYRP